MSSPELPRKAVSDSHIRTTRSDHEGPPLLEVHGVTKYFPVTSRKYGRRATLKAVDGVTLSVDRGEILALVGESGSGKSTLARVILGLIQPTSGAVVFNGKDVTSAGKEERAQFRRRVQPVFQDPFSSLDPRWTIGRTVREALDVYRVGTSVEREARVNAALDEVGLPQRFVDRRPSQMSGGQLQRVAIAAALAIEPELLVADEPVSALDVSVQAQVLNLMVDLRQRLGLAILFVAHDLAVVEHISDRIAVMYLGRIVEIGTTTQVFGRPQHPYTQALIEAIPHPDPSHAFKPTSPIGEMPSPVEPPPGCSFHTRCPVAVDACRRDDPQLFNLSSHHQVACHVVEAAARQCPGEVGAFDGKSSTRKGA